MTRPCPACGAGETRPFAEKHSYRLVRCRRCATLFTAEEAGNVYDDYYGETNLNVPAFVAKRLDDIVATFAPWRRSGRLLDVGFGAGELLDAARRAGWNASGVEVAFVAVEQARRRGLDAFHGLLADAGYEPASFDVVVVSEILEHISGARALLADVARVLRPGGLLWATTPHGRGLSARILGARWSVIDPPEHVQLFSIRGLRQLLGETGFGDIDISAEGVNPREILRGGRMSGLERTDAAYALNAFFEERPARRAVKRAVNRVLSALRLGDSLKVTARRLGPDSCP